MLAVMSVSSRVAGSCSPVRKTLLHIIDSKTARVSDSSSPSSHASLKRVGTNNGSFHCDEALGCFMIRLTRKFFNAQIVRTRDPQCRCYIEHNQPKLLEWLMVLTVKSAAEGSADGASEEDGSAESAVDGAVDKDAGDDFGDIGMIPDVQEDTIAGLDQGATDAEPFICTCHTYLFLDLFFLETLELSTSSSIRRGIGIDDDVDSSSVSKKKRSKKRSGDGLGNVGMMP
ncbi:MYG1 exonuclease [Trifolium repens]|nr:MYG1 exonuclease [Trifolium repens]